MENRKRGGELSRRQVLKGVGGAAALAAAGWPGLTGAASHEAYDCIVLGAGIAGVTAARDLHRSGFRVLLLEGSSRVGGRMFTLRDFVRNPRHAGSAGRFPIEAGAEYVHIGDLGRYPEFFAELDRHGFSRRKLSKLKRNRLAFPDWKRNPKKLLKALLRNTNLIPTVTLLPGIKDFDRERDLPAGEYVKGKSYKGKGIHLARYTLSSHTPGLLFDSVFDGFEPTDIVTCRVPGPAPVDTISVAGIRADRLPDQLVYETAEYRLECPGGAGEPEVCGYDTLPRRIADEFLDPAASPAGRAGELLLGQRVLRVERRGDGMAVRVRSEGGEEREFLGRSAISTFSVGMLDPARGQGDAVFGALLTAAKREALRSVRMGPITKFSLEFRKSHWGRKARMSVMSHPRGCARTFFSAFPGNRKGPFVLTGLLMNQDHEIISSLDDEAAVQHLLDILHSVFRPRAHRRGERWRPQDVLVPRSTGPFRPNFHRQDWGADPFALGGNSYIAYRSEVGSAEVAKLRQALRDPRESLPLFWAGEATAPAYHPRYQPLSVHGAYISGAGVAKDVQRYLEEGASMEAFRAYYEAQREAAAAVELSMAAAAPATVGLSRQELEAIQAYADRSTDGDLSAAVRELFRTGLYLQEHDPRSLHARAAPAARQVELPLDEEEERRVGTWAARYTDGDRERTIRALLRRGLRAAG